MLLSILLATELNLKKESAFEDKTLSQKQGIFFDGQIYDAYAFEIYHIGASLKDLGKKWFAFSKFEMSTLDILNKLK